MVYHLAYRPLVDGVPSETLYGPLQLLARYGYLGVILFFIINGDLRFDFMTTQAVSLTSILAASGPACRACAGVR